jgi:hypothetical protein
MSALDFEPNSAQCRLFARGSQRDFAFSAAGSRQYVAGATLGAALGYGVASAIEQNQNLNDCMIARGWRVADGPASTMDMPHRLANARQCLLAGRAADTVLTAHGRYLMTYKEGDPLPGDCDSLTRRP